jgi:hypothetical protein
LILSNHFLSSYNFDFLNKGETKMFANSKKQNNNQSLELNKVRKGEKIMRKFYFVTALLIAMLVASFSFTPPAALAKDPNPVENQQTIIPLPIFSLVSEGKAPGHGSPVRQNPAETWTYQGWNNEGGYGEWVNGEGTIAIGYCLNQNQRGARVGSTWTQEVDISLEQTIAGLGAEPGLTQQAIWGSLDPEYQVSTEAQQLIDQAREIGPTEGTRVDTDRGNHHDSQDVIIVTPTPTTPPSVTPSATPSETPVTTVTPTPVPTDEPGTPTPTPTASPTPKPEREKTSNQEIAVHGLAENQIWEQYDSEAVPGQRDENCMGDAPTMPSMTQIYLWLERCSDFYLWDGYYSWIKLGRFCADRDSSRFTGLHTVKAPLIEVWMDSASFVPGEYRWEPFLPPFWKMGDPLPAGHPDFDWYEAKRLALQ